VTKFETAQGKPEVMRPPKLFLDDDHAGKVIGIDLFIGKRPYDEEREYAYGPAGGLPDTKVGSFSLSLMDEAKSRGWTVISMKCDWKRIFA
jgi:hypothetical protein